MNVVTQGYSLIELLIGFSIFVALTLTAIPVWHMLMVKENTQTMFDQLITAINLARNEAIKRGVPVSICKSRDQIHCCGEWNDGQIIFIDKDASGVVHTEADILAVFNKPITRGRLYWHGLRSADYLQFNSSGATNEQNGSFIYCPDNHDNHSAHALIISQTGRVRLSQDADHDGIDEDENGQPLNCSRDLFK